MEKKIQKKKSVLREWLEVAPIALILALIIRTFIVQAFKIPSGSMRPTLQEGDRILVNKFIYGAKIPFVQDMRLPRLRGPERGDVIVFIYPMDRKRDFIKRLIAEEGESVKIRNGKIYIEGALLDDPQFASELHLIRLAFFLIAMQCDHAECLQPSASRLHRPGQPPHLASTTPKFDGIYLQILKP